MRELAGKSVQTERLRLVEMGKFLENPPTVWFNILLSENSLLKKHFTPSTLVKNALVHCTNVFLKKSGVGLCLQLNKGL